jgi:hypothetical protein
MYYVSTKVLLGAVHRKEVEVVSELRREYPIPLYRRNDGMARCLGADRRSRPQMTADPE